MHPTISDRMDQIKSRVAGKHWYVVRQKYNIVDLCYLVAALRDYQNSDMQKSIADFVATEITQLNSSNPALQLTDNYRALRGAAFLGLIKMDSSGDYENAQITPTFAEIQSRCGGSFELTETYSQVIQRQIEKMYISSDLDKATARRDFKLYPVLLLYKLLLELGRATNDYSVSRDEFENLIATTERFQDFISTLSDIMLFRKDPSALTQLKKELGLDHRWWLVLKLLPTLNLNHHRIVLKQESITEVAQKVFAFEQSPEQFTINDDKYLTFLGSTRSLFDLINNNDFELLNGPSDLELIDREPIGENTLYYGVPGSGKSHLIDSTYAIAANRLTRVVFHPDYTYGDFVGQILPKVKADGGLTYEFTPGPFAHILRAAYYDPNNSYYLIIEEINRGNAAAIFGDIIQLLDRFDQPDPVQGFPSRTSKYSIINPDLANYVYRKPLEPNGTAHSNHPIRIPANLAIIGTMNTADQNVFTVDTAFQRRWNMRIVPNIFKPGDSLGGTGVVDTGVPWQVFSRIINDEILSRNAHLLSTEDKRLGTHFVSTNELQEANAFAEKVIKYLWDDAFKFDRKAIFDLPDNEPRSLEDMIAQFTRPSGLDRFAIFTNDVRNKLAEQADTTSPDLDNANSV